MSVSEKILRKEHVSFTNWVLNIIQKAKTPFFLTGGTALSRYYTYHRFSDDLDFFVIDDPAYTKHVDVILKKLIETEKTGIFHIERNLLNKGS